MANAYSERANFLGPVSSMNHQLDMMVLGAKQQSYDANIAKIDSIIETYGNIPLARAQDREMLASNINQMLVEVNSVSKDALTNPNTVRSMQQVMKGALTPEIMKQSAITRQKMDFDTKVAKKREKNDGTYSDGNYQDALDQSNWEAYMRGETNDINPLHYNDYVDEGKVLRDAVTSWGEKFGYETVIDASATGTSGITLMSKGKKLSSEKVSGFIESVISSDSKLQTQIGINSRLSFRGMSDDQVKDMYTKNLKDFESNTQTSVLEAEALRNNYGKDTEDYKYYDTRIKQLKGSLESMKAPLEGNFNRRAVQQGMYTNNLIRGFADNYSYDRIESYDFDTTFFDADMKIQDMQLKQEANALKREANNLTQGLDAQGNPLRPGVVTEEDPGLKDEGTAVDTLLKGYDSDFKEIDNQLTTELGTEYSSKSLREKMRYINTLNDISSEFDINNSSLSHATLDKVASFQKRAKEVGEYKASVTKNLTPILKENYDLLLQGGNSVNLNSLSATMPNTAKVLRNRTDYASLSANEKRLVDAEIAKSTVDFLVTSKEDKQDWQLFQGELNKKLTPEERTAIQRTGGEKYSTVGGVARYGREAVGNVLGAAGTAISSAYNFMAGNAEQARRIYNDGEREYMEATERQSQILSDTYNPFTVFVNDRNLGNMQGGDIRSDRSLTDRFNTSMSTHRDAMKPKRDAIKSQRQVNNIITLNPEVKKDKAVVADIDSIVRSQNVIPKKDGNYSMKMSGNNYIFTVDVESGTGKDKVTIPTPVTIPAEQVPTSIKNVLSNVKAPATPSDQGFKYKIPTDSESKIDTTTRFLNSFGPGAPAGALDNIYTGKAFKEAVELLEPYQYKLKTQEQIAYANSLVNSDYTSKVITLPSGKTIVDLRRDGKSTGLTSERFVRDGISNGNSYTFASMTAALAEEYINENLRKM